MNNLIALSITGLALSIYALYVERQAKKSPYRAICDFGTHVSCSAAFSSPYGKTFGIHNGWYGIAYYTLVPLLAYVHHYALFFVASIAVLKSLQLANILYFEQHNFCIVCTITYLINATILFIAWQGLSITI